jgi:hypothetical protein
MGGACRTHGKDKIAYDILVEEKSEGKDAFERLVHDRIILNASSRNRVRDGVKFYFFFLLYFRCIKLSSLLWAGFLIDMAIKLETPRTSTGITTLHAAKRSEKNTQ